MSPLFFILLVLKLNVSSHPRAYETETQIFVWNCNPHTVRKSEYCHSESRLEVVSVDQISKMSQFFFFHDSCVFFLNISDYHFVRGAGFPPPAKKILFIRLFLFYNFKTKTKKVLKQPLLILPAKRHWAKRKTSPLHMRNFHPLTISLFYFTYTFDFIMLILRGG